MRSLARRELLLLLFALPLQSSCSFACALLLLPAMMLFSVGPQRRNSATGSARTATKAAENVARQASNSKFANGRGLRYTQNCGFGVRCTDKRLTASGKRRHHRRRRRATGREASTASEIANRRTERQIRHIQPDCRVRQAKFVSFPLLESIDSLYGIGVVISMQQRQQQQHKQQQQQ